MRGTANERNGESRIAKVMVETRPVCRSLPLPTDSMRNKLLSSNHDHLAGNCPVYERCIHIQQVYNPNAVYEDYEYVQGKLGPGGYDYHGNITLSLPGGRWPPSRLLCCSALYSCSYFLLLPRSNPFGLSNWSPFGISYAREYQAPDGYTSWILLTRCVQHRKVELNLIIVKFVLSRGQRTRRNLHLRR